MKCPRGDWLLSLSVTWILIITFALVERRYIIKLMRLHYDDESIHQKQGLQYNFLLQNSISLICHSAKQYQTTNGAMATRMTYKKMKSIEQKTEKPLRCQEGNIFSTPRQPELPPLRWEGCTPHPCMQTMIPVAAAGTWRSSSHSVRGLVLLCKFYPIAVIFWIKK